MPMGLTNAPSSFQCIMSNMFIDIKKISKIYINDIIINSVSTDEHLQNLILYLNDSRNGLYMSS